MNGFNIKQWALPSAVVTKNDFGKSILHNEVGITIIKIKGTDLNWYAKIV